ncbi:MAG: hypothetical protein HY548_04720, partial [Elusimicrobia bacterium]|nr:hypothetical protein [Elusimicrobiota bacterium]
MKDIRVMISSALFLVFSLASLWAGVPNRIVYQGRLAKSGVSVSGPHVFVARFIGTDGKQLWSSGNLNVTLPVTGDFTLTLEPTGIN